jgi:hypothetical protein
MNGTAVSRIPNISTVFGFLLAIMLAKMLTKKVIMTIKILESKGEKNRYDIRKISQKIICKGSNFIILWR